MRDDPQDGQAGREKWQAGEDLTAPRRKVERNIDAFRDLVVDKVEATRGRISAKRLLPIVRAAGYEGSGRNFRVWSRR